MPKEYRTIQEIAGPLMLVRGVEGVTYDELGEIELVNGETRRCKVLEVNGSDVLVQLFESSTGINPASTCPTAKSVSSGGAWSWAYLKTCWAVYLTAWAVPSTTDRRSCRRPAWISTACP